jgi:hypothetical protein
VTARPATSELRDGLESGLRLRRPGSSVRALARRPSPVRSSFALEELEATLDDGSTLELVFKDVGPDGLSDAGRRAKPGFLHGRAREIEMYRRVLPRAPTGPPRCLATTVDPSRRRYWLFLERVAGAPLWEEGDLAVWQRAAGWLAQLHRAFRGCADPPLAGGRLLRYDTAFHVRWLSRARRLRRSDAEAATFLDRLAPRYRAVLGRIDALPRTLVHGDAYPSNMIVTGERVCLVDWELAGIGPGLWDLAALTAGAWTDDERAALAQAYRSTRPDDVDFEVGLEACRLALAVQWLGWGDDWSPPREHRHDWLAEATRSAERLGL